jgi:hypothetical protein
MPGDDRFKGGFSSVTRAVGEPDEKLGIAQPDHALGPGNQVEISMQRL